MLWVLVGCVTLLAVGAIAFPLLRNGGKATDRVLYDRAVYRDQLAELGREVERGTLAPEEAASARLEIERRLLGTTEPDQAAAGGPVDPLTVISLGAAVSAAAIALYLGLGSPGIRDQPVASRGGAPASAASAEAPPPDLLKSADRLAQKLRDNPNDVEGWVLLGRTQSVLERWQDAAASYKKAMELSGNRPDATAAYGEMLTLAADGIVTPPAREAFALAVQGDPSEPAARYYLGLADAQAGKPAEAIEAWTRIVAEAPADAPFVGMIRSRIEETAREAGLPAPKLPAPAAAEAPRGPSAADMEAAAKMNPDDRQAMIRTMVDGLAARLEQNPNDAAGWQRLANAYRVLGETEKARQAEERGKAVAGKDGAAPAPAPARGPGQAEIDAAGKMSPAERQTMIRGMVDGLAERLRQNPDDAAGWLRLGRAYRVLGDHAKAQDALEKATSLQPGNVEMALDAARAMLDGSPAGTDAAAKLPDGFVTIIKRVAALEPQNPEALWFLGLAAAQERRGDEALGYWERLLAQLPPGGEDYKTVRQAMDALPKPN